MKNRKIKWISHLSILIGSVLLLGMLGLCLWNFFEGKRAGEAAARLAETLVQEMPKPFSAVVPQAWEESSSKESTNNAEGELVSSEDRSRNAAGRADEALPSKKKSQISEESAARTAFSIPTIDIAGTPYLGILSIPSEGLELPVAADWSYPQLAECPCRFYGDAFSGNLVIAGHNYGDHFWPLLHLPIGEEVYFTAADGATYRDLVANRETLAGQEVEKLVSQTTVGDWDLTLVTCTPCGGARCVVRCVRS